MWCSSTRRCVDSNAYIISFPYGQCLEWQTATCSRECLCGLTLIEQHRKSLLCDGKWNYTFEEVFFFKCKKYCYSLLSNLPILQAFDLCCTIVLNLIDMLTGRCLFASFSSEWVSVTNSRLLHPSAPFEGRLLLCSASSAVSMSCFPLKTFVTGIFEEAISVTLQVSQCRVVYLFLYDEFHVNQCLTRISCHRWYITYACGCLVIRWESH